MRSLDEDIPWHLSKQLFLSDYWDLFHNLSVFIGNHDAISVLDEVDNPHLLHFYLNSNLLSEVDHFSFLNDVVDGAFDFVVFWLSDYERHPHLNFFDLLSCLIDVMWHFDYLLHLDVLSASDLDQFLDIAELHTFYYALDFDLDWHLLALVNWHCFFADHWHFC